MHLFYFCNEAVGVCNLWESLFLGNLGKVLVEFAPFLAFAGSGFGKVCLGVGDYAGRVCGVDFDSAAFEEREEHACVAEFLLCCFEEYGSYLFVAFFFSLFGE